MERSMHRLFRSACHVRGRSATPLTRAASTSSHAGAAWAIEPEPHPSLAVVGDSRRFPVNRIWCVGRNYSEHAQEMRAAGDTSGDAREPPFFFLKPGNALVSHGAGQDSARALTVEFPPATQNYHFEVEMVVAIGIGGAGIASAKALDHVYGYAVGLDMTRRDLQNAAKKSGRPWTAAKAFHQSAPCSPIIPLADLPDGHPRNGAIWLDVNGKRAQEANINQLTWNVPDTIAALSATFTLSAGDIIMTGTPAGVGPVVQGDVMVAGVDISPNNPSVSHLALTTVVG